MAWLLTTVLKRMEDIQWVLWQHLPVPMGMLYLDSPQVPARIQEPGTVGLCLVNQVMK